MTRSNNPLETLADRMRASGTPPHRLRETLEASLIPLVQRALRSGAGMPHLVHWVKTTLPQVEAGQGHAHPDRAASLAHLLCSTLLDQRPAWPARPAAVAEAVVPL